MRSGIVLTQHSYASVQRTLEGRDMARHTDSATSGPLGLLRGMTYDPVRRRYFPSTAPSPAASSSSSSSSSASSASSTGSSSSSGSAATIRTDRLPTREELRRFSYSGARRWSREHGLPPPVMCDRDRSKRRRIKEQREFEAQLKRENEEAEQRLDMLDQEGVSRTFRRRTILRAKRDTERYVRYRQLFGAELIRGIARTICT